MTTNRLLPPGFAELEPFVAEWALRDEGERLAKLQRSTIPELRKFYDAVFARAEEAKKYLWDKKLDGLAEDDKRLFLLLMTFIETAHPIELNWSVTDESASHNKLEIAHISPIPD
jgi:hypothetical protein